MDKYQGMVYSQAIKATGSAEEAEDLTQDVFLKAFEGLSAFRGEALFSTWIYKIAQNELIRRSKKSHDIQLENHEEIDSLALSSLEKLKKWSSHFTPEMQYLKSEMTGKVRNLIARLPAAYKKPLVLYYFENMSYNEISDHLNLKLNTLKSYIFRGKEILKGWLKENE
ncbi:MAG: RNA polymerase sigma factor [Leptospira sp.]|nr:RNA polymerase sigma factor [Leptospira sp.]